MQVQSCCDLIWTLKFGLRESRNIQQVFATLYVDRVGRRGQQEIEDF